MAGTGNGWRFWYADNGVETWVEWTDDSPIRVMKQKRELEFKSGLDSDGVFRVWSREVCLQWTRDVPDWARNRDWTFRKVRHARSWNQLR